MQTPKPIPSEGVTGICPSLGRPHTEPTGGTWAAGEAGRGLRGEAAKADSPSQATQPKDWLWRGPQSKAALRQERTGMEGPYLNKTAIVLVFSICKENNKELGTRGETGLHHSKCLPSRFLIIMI